MASSLADFLLPAADVDSVETPRRLIRAGAIATALLLIAIGCWMSLAPLGGAAIAPGVVKVDLNRKTVQHQEGGIVGEILVRDGDKVKAGDTLIVLKDIRVDASNELVQTQLDAELVKAARLAAEQAWADAISFPEELQTRSGDPRVAELLQRETHLFNARRAAYDKQIHLIRSQITETKGEITVRNGQLTSDDSAIKLHREELEANQALLEQGFVSKTRLLALQRSVAEAEARRGENDAERSRARQKVEELALRAETLRSTFSQEAAGEYRQTTAQIFDLRQRVRPAQDAEQRQRVTAPSAGEIVDMRVTAVGAIIAPREPI